MWRGLQPAEFRPCKDETPQAEARATKIGSGPPQISLFNFYSNLTGGFM
jgi:hypothetical protein